MRSGLFIVAAFAALTATDANADPFADLRAAYAVRDPVAAAAAYDPGATVTYRYRGSPEERHVGRAAIEASFRALFDQIDAREKLDLNFRETRRDGNVVEGLYRLRLGNASTSYGRFAVTIGAKGSFSSDLSTSADVTDFENAAGPVMLAVDDEALDRGYYGALTGRYNLTDGCVLVVTRSLVRLFVRNTCTNSWRGLTRVSGLEWTAGDRVISSKRSSTYRFSPQSGGKSEAVEVVTGSVVKTASRRTPYRTEDIAFASADGTMLVGTIYLPTRTSSRRPASVMIHGSGPQDRDGYASIIAVMADELAANGRVVLAFDKRGSGASKGNGDRAGFDVLASDVVAAMAALRRRPEVDEARIGLAGSSQAGWVAAKVVASGEQPADVLLLGAAGAALTVAEQNLYNTRERMRCSGAFEADVRLALQQQQAFFAFLADPRKARRLDELTSRARSRPSLSDWLFPDSKGTDRSTDAWYVVLDPVFDPLPIWRSYQGGTLFLFGEHDDATPTKLAINRLRGAGIQASLIPAAQHLGLTATGLCKGELGDLEVFAPEVLSAISSFASRGG